MLVSIPSLMVARGTPRTVFSPSDLSGLNLWLKADSLSLNDGDPVSSWTDSSGKGNHATGTGANRPVFKTNIINGYPIVQFTNANTSYVDAPNGALTGITSAVSAFVVQRSTSLQNNAGLSSNPGDAANQFNSPIAYGDGNVYFDLGNTTVGRVSAAWGGSTSTFYVWSFVAGAGTMTIRRNNTNLISSSGKTNAFTAGTKDLLVGYLESCDKAEVLVYNNALSTDNHLRVDQYLGVKYGITIA